MKPWHTLAAIILLIVSLMAAYSQGQTQNQRVDALGPA
jgi:hypothetical protein